MGADGWFGQAVTNGLRTNGSTPTPDPVLVAIQGMREDVNRDCSLDRRITPEIILAQSA